MKKSRPVAGAAGRDDRQLEDRPYTTPSRSPQIADLAPNWRTLGTVLAKIVADIEAPS